MKSATKADLLCNVIMSRLEYIRLVIGGSHYDDEQRWQLSNNAVMAVSQQLHKSRPITVEDSLQLLKMIET